MKQPKIKNQALAFRIDAFRHEWEDFAKRAVKHDNIDYYNNLQDDAGHYEALVLKKQKVFLAKFYIDDMEVHTDVSKRNFFLYAKGQDVDIWGSVMESIIADLEHVVIVEENGIYEPFAVAENLSEAKEMEQELKGGGTNVNILSFVEAFDLYDKNKHQTTHNFILKSLLLEKQNDMIVVKSISVKDGHLTAIDKRHITEMFRMGLMNARTKKKGYKITFDEKSKIYSVVVFEKNRGIGLGGKLRTDKFKSTFTITKEKSAKPLNESIGDITTKEIENMEKYGCYDGDGKKVTESKVVKGEPYSRYEARSMKGVKVVAKDKSGKAVGYFKPTKWGIFDTKQNEFIIVTNKPKESEKYDARHAFDSWDKKVAKEIQDDFNNNGGTSYGDIDLPKIERMK